MSTFLTIDLNQFVTGFVLGLTLFVIFQLSRFWIEHLSSLDHLFVISFLLTLIKALTRIVIFRIIVVNEREEEEEREEE